MIVDISVTQDGGLHMASRDRKHCEKFQICTHDIVFGNIEIQCIVIYLLPQLLVTYYLPS